jgi:N-carbamoyl-L-amino-acid hydrolase
MAFAPTDFEWSELTMSDVVSLLRQIEDTGRDVRGPGYQRPGFSATERELRDWFLAEAARRGLDIEIDANGITWAWATPPGENAVVTGSHLDSVPGGGEFDGPLGVASALAAFDELKSSGALERARRPLALAVFPEEEGSRFGVACLGSRLLTGAIDAERALGLKDSAGDTFAEVARGYGLDPERVGRDQSRLAGIGSFIELHVEQGIGLIGHRSGRGHRLLDHRPRSLALLLHRAGQPCRHDADEPSRRSGGRGLPCDRGYPDPSGRH